MRSEGILVEDETVTGPRAPAGPDGVFAWGTETLGWPADPYRAYDLARSKGPVVRARMRNGRAVWLVLGYDEAKAALADPRLSTDGRRFLRRYWSQASDGEGHAPDSGASDGGQASDGEGQAPDSGTQGPDSGLDEMSLAEHMLSTDPPDHTRLRRLVSQAFTPSRVESMRPRVQAIADALADDLATALAPDHTVPKKGFPQGGTAAGKTADLISLFAFPLPVRVISELMGVPSADEDRFRHWFRAMVTVSPGEEARQASQAAAFEVARYLQGLLAAKRAEPADDLISALVAARDGDQVLDEAELMSMVFLLLLAGHETTVNLIGNGMLALMGDPQQLARLRTDPALVGPAVEELLRYDGPVHHPTLRFAMEPVRLGSATIPAGAIVLVSLAAANRDPGRFADPNRLEMARGTPHLAFGHGPHFCLGAPLARMEGQIAFSVLVDRFPDMAVAMAPSALRWRDGIFLRGLEALPVRLGR